MVMSVLDKPKQTAVSALADTVGLLPNTFVLTVRYGFADDADKGEFIASCYATHADVRAESVARKSGDHTWFEHAPNHAMDITASVAAHLQAARFSMVKTAEPQPLDADQRGLLERMQRRALKIFGARLGASMK